MKAIIVDDEPLAIKYMNKLCLEMKDLEVCATFHNVFEALYYIQNNNIDLVLMDIEMPGLSGIEAVRKIRKSKPDTAVIFITAYEEYALSAFKLDAIDYIIKPCSKEMLQKALDKASRLLPVNKDRIVIQTFGYFTVYIDGESYPFANRKAKELLALLIDRRGGQVTMEQATSILWENRPYDNMVKQLYRKAIAYLRAIEKEKDIILFESNRGVCQAVLRQIYCDYFQFIEGDNDTRRRFVGEYMLDYSWAEATLGKLVQYFSE